MGKHVDDLQNNASSNDVIGGDDAVITGNVGNGKFKAIPSSKGFVSKQGLKKAILQYLGIVFPAYTQLEIDAMQGISEHYVIENTDTSELIRWNGTDWVSLGSGGGDQDLQSVTENGSTSDQDVTVKTISTTAGKIKFDSPPGVGLPVILSESGSWQNGENVSIGFIAIGSYGQGKNTESYYSVISGSSIIEVNESNAAIKYSLLVPPGTVAIRAVIFDCEHYGSAADAPKTYDFFDNEIIIDPDSPDLIYVIDDGSLSYSDDPDLIDPQPLEIIVGDNNLDGNVFFPAIAEKTGAGALFITGYGKVYSDPSALGNETPTLQQVHDAGNRIDDGSANFQLNADNFSFQDTSDNTECNVGSAAIQLGATDENNTFRLVEITTKGIKYPEYTTEARDALTNVSTAQHIYNIDTKQVEYWDATEWRAISWNVRPYKVYTALLTQSGTGSPSAITLENTLGCDISYSYGSTGYYLLQATEPVFTNGKTVCLQKNATYVMLSNSPVQYCFSANLSGADTIGIGTNLGPAFSNGVDGVLYDFLIEIRVYN